MGNKPMWKMNRKDDLRGGLARLCMLIGHEGATKLTFCVFRGLTAYWGPEQLVPGEKSDYILLCGGDCRQIGSICLIYHYVHTKKFYDFVATDHLPYTLFNFSMLVPYSLPSVY